MEADSLPSRAPGRSGIGSTHSTLPTLPTIGTDAYPRAHEAPSSRAASRHPGRSVTGK